MKFFKGCQILLKYNQIKAFFTLKNIKFITMRSKNDLTLEQFLEGQYLNARATIKMQFLNPLNS